MPPKSKKQKASGRDPNQPSLLSFWAKAKAKSSSNQNTEKGATARPSAVAATTNLQNVGIRPTFQHKKRRVSLEHEPKGSSTEKRQQNSSTLIEGTASSSAIQAKQQASVMPQVEETTKRLSPPRDEAAANNSTMLCREKEHHAVSPDTNGNVQSRNSRQSPSSNTKQPVKSNTPREQNDNSSDTHEEGKEQEILESRSESPAKTSGNPQGLSDYELLRLRNIARNNARLEALGLLDPMVHQTAKITAKRPAKKRPNNRKASCKSDHFGGPKRRSTRLSKPKSGTTDMDADNTAGISENKHKQEAKQEEEEETYIVSPLVQYEMSTKSTRVSATSSLSSSSSLVSGAEDNCDEKGEIINSETSTVMSLIPTGQRFAAPQGLSAIYSLNFCSNGAWLVGAGKAGIVALWKSPPTSLNHQRRNEEDSSDSCEDQDEIDMIDPIFSWKAHNGRWISEAQFISNNNNNNESSMAAGAAAVTNTSAPSRLVTAANDGTVCLWDLSKVSTVSGTPKVLQQSDKTWHSSGIFAMDTTTSLSRATEVSSSHSVKIATASKDKTVAITSDLETFSPTWRSYVHTAKVGAVKFRDEHVLASASDDGSVAILDDRMKDKDAAPVALLEGLHNGRPHSVVWNHHNKAGGSAANIFLTAGLDSVIQAWDSRYLKKGSDGQFCPVAEYVGHVPTSTRRCKRIHHPVFFHPFRHRNNNSDCFVLTGGEGSHSLSLFGGRYNAASDSSAVTSRTQFRAPVLSRGLLPTDCNHADVGSICIHEDRVVASVDGEILLLKPST